MSNILDIPGEVLASIFSGWVVTWPTALLSLIWLGWISSWIIASVWSGRTKTAVRTFDSWVYRGPILLGAIFLAPPIERLLGATPLYHLGRFWSNAITHKEDHRIIDTGPYGVVRHPIYTGQIVGMIATGIAIGNWAAILGTLLIPFGEWQKARMEERFLSVELGTDAYAAYCRRVPMIIPFLRPSAG
jgi:protein-S-isoprenylcysteine O-methyltransferase Ste14